MFTGLIEEVGKITGIIHGSKSCALQVSGSVIFEDLKLGDSVAVNGVCLTANSVEKSSFRADVMNETLSRSALGLLRQNSPVNLERAMPANGRFGGHIVSGHIDGTGRIENIVRDDIAFWYTIRTSRNLLRYIVEKGSVAVDGISLTVAAVLSDHFKVSIIPHTNGATTLPSKSVGDLVNLENDVIAKYIEQLFGSEQASGRTSSGKITREFLARAGYG